MNPVRMIVLGVALLAGMVCVGLLARGMVASKPRPAAPIAQIVHPTVQVLVAKRDLSVGEHVGEADMGWQAWPAENVNPAYVTDAGAARAGSPPAAPTFTSTAGQMASAATAAVSGQALGAGASFVGTIVREKILSGEPLIAEKLVRPGAAGAMAVSLDAGMRALALPLTAESAAGGFILPGDHVDLVLNRQVETPATGGAPAGKTFAANTVIKNVRVLAIDQNTGPQKGDAVIGATATVELSPDQVRTVVEAKAAGQLTFILRSYADAGGPPVIGEDAPQASVVNVYRAGAPATVMVTR